MKSILKNNGLSLALVAASVIWAYFQMDALPAQIPSHYDINGTPDKHDSKYFLMILFPAMSLFSIFLLAGLAKFSPRGFEMPNSQQLVGIFNFGLTAFLTTMYVGIILDAKDPSAHLFPKMILPAMALFLIFMGNYFGKLERNFFLGIRLPWTLASEENWRRTHRFAGRVFVIGGLAALAVSFLPLAVPHNFFAMMVIMAATSLLSVAYSFYYFIKYEKQAS